MMVYVVFLFCYSLTVTVSKQQSQQQCFSHVKAQKYNKNMVKNIKWQHFHHIDILMKHSFINAPWEKFILILFLIIYCTHRETEREKPGHASDVERRRHDGSPQGPEQLAALFLLVHAGLKLATKTSSCGLKFPKTSGLPPFILVWS